MARRSVSDIAWAAGFFDGEGCIHLQRRNQRGIWRYNLLVSVSNTVETPIERFHEMFEGRTSESRRIAQSQYVLYEWRIDCKKAASALTIMFPYLCVKKNEAEIAIAFQNRRIGIGKKISDPIEKAAYYSEDAETYAKLRQVKISDRVMK